MSPERCCSVDAVECVLEAFGAVCGLGDVERWCESGAWRGASCGVGVQRRHKWHGRAVG